MNIHEYQAKALLARRGVDVPAGRVVSSPEQAAAAWDELRVSRAIVKAQVHAGGRGKAGGIVPASSRIEAEGAARRLLGSDLKTHQTGGRGLPVNRVLIEEALDIRGAFYLSISLDRERGCPLAVASARGGVEIEELARTEPDAMAKEPGSPFTGLDPFHARNLFASLNLPHDRLRGFTDLVTALGSTFVALDCSLIELNPLALLADGRFVAADAKMSFDDNALFRRPEIADLSDPTQEDPREVEAQRHDLSYVGLDGDIGCMVNGAGLAMATMDLIRLHGGEPANFLDVGGAATAEKVAAAFRILCADPRVRVILINIFGGIVRCDLIAEGVLSAMKETAVAAPIVARLEGNMAAEGRKALSDSGLRITPAESLEEAAIKAVSLTKTEGNREIHESHEKKD